MKKKISEIFAKKSSLFAKEINVNGWVKSIRKGKSSTFISINDGTTLLSLQVFFSSSFFLENEEKIEKISIGSALGVTGILVETPSREQPFELRAGGIIHFSSSSNDFLNQKKRLPLPFVRNFPHLRAKTNFFLSLSRIRSRVGFLINSFFQKNDFLYVNTPIITSNDAEGAGQSFFVDSKEKKFFSKIAKLTVSGQLHAESLSQGFGKVYNFSPCFRAENSNTNRHLSEFWMIEAEASFADLREIIKCSEKLLKYVFKNLLKENQSELLFFENFNDQPITSNLRSIVSKKFPVITYSKAIEIIKQKIKNDNFHFKINSVTWGSDLNSEHEKYLCEYFNSPVFVVNYPKKIKAFYMKENRDQKTVSCMDLLFPKIGELIGGSAREDNFQKIDKRIKEERITKSLSWYSDLRKSGYAPSAGFGMGFERLLMFITGLENIRDVIPFPRSSKELEF